MSTALELLQTVRTRGYTWPGTQVTGAHLFELSHFLREVAGQVRDVEDLNRVWREWLPWYNERRPHSSIGQVPPARRFQASCRAAPAELEQLLRVEVQRKVGRDCTISLAGKRY